jgi:hypothetical protein
MKELQVGMKFENTALNIVYEVALAATPKF